MVAKRILFAIFVLVASIGVVSVLILRWLAICVEWWGARRRCIHRCVVRGIVTREVVHADLVRRCAGGVNRARGIDCLAVVRECNRGEKQAEN